MPLIILAVLEIVLRVFNYGDNFDLFVESKIDKNYLVLNPSASRKYFVNQALAPSGNREFFKKIKDKNTIRIFVLGESTTIGYPYFHNGSFSRWLSYRLMHCLPDQDFEIINLSLTAVNSYTVLDFAKQLVAYEPDAVFIYSGQNEYYGALGVGSTNSFGNNRTLINSMLKLRELKIIQLLSNIYEKVTHPKNARPGTLMEMMVGEQQIPYQSTLYNKGIEQFRLNLDETLQLFNKQHIPVFVSTLVSNDRDLKPFAVIDADSSRLPNFKTNYDAGITALLNHDSSTAYRYLQQANAFYGKNALCNYTLGKLACEQADYTSARGFFSKARDLDALRFRAPSEMNTIIVQLCNKYQNTHLVDSKTAFESYSKQHLIGNELMLEHVHPNLKGYAIMSDVFYTAIKAAHIILVAKENEMSLEQLQRQMPITRMDSLSGIYRIVKLKRSWPFSRVMTQDSFDIKSWEEKIAYELAFGEVQWADATDSLYNYYVANNDLSNAATVMQSLVLEHPGKADLYERTAMLFGKMNDLADAAFYFRKAFVLSPSVEKARYLFVIYFKLDKPAEAIPYLDYSIQNSPMAATLLSIKSFAGEILELKKKYAGDSTDLDISNKIAGLYLRMGNKEIAEVYAKKVLRTDKHNKEALLMLSKLGRG